MTQVNIAIASYGRYCFFFLQPGKQKGGGNFNVVSKSCFQFSKGSGLTLAVQHEQHTLPEVAQ